MEGGPNIFLFAIWKLIWISGQYKCLWIPKLWTWSYLFWNYNCIKEEKSSLPGHHANVHTCLGLASRFSVLVSIYWDNRTIHPGLSWIKHYVGGQGALILPAKIAKPPPTSNVFWKVPNYHLVWVHQRLSLLWLMVLWNSPCPQTHTCC